MIKMADGTLVGSTYIGVPKEEYAALQSKLQSLEFELNAKTHEAEIAHGEIERLRKAIADYVIVSSEIDDAERVGRDMGAEAYERRDQAWSALVALKGEKA